MGVRRKDVVVSQLAGISATKELYAVLRGSIEAEPGSFDAGELR